MLSYPPELYHELVNCHQHAKTLDDLMRYCDNTAAPQFELSWLRNLEYLNRWGCETGPGICDLDIATVRLLPDGPLNFGVEFTPPGMTVPTMFGGLNFHGPKDMNKLQAEIASAEDRPFRWWQSHHGWSVNT